MTPLLQLDKVTVRFGGLTAVDKVDCAVAEGSIQSIIGPNGAGKTTVFNVITGIYEPTEGQITFDGRDLRRPVTWRIVVASIAIGIATSFLAFLIAVDANSLWNATIKRNFAAGDKSFSYQTAWESVQSYWRGDLAIEKTFGSRWSVVNAEGTQTLGTVKSREEAEALKKSLQAEMASGDNERLNEIAGAAIARRRFSWFSIVGGFLLGTAGALTVWNRARRTPDVIACAGIARTFQNIRLFKDMTVLENVLTAMDRHMQVDALRMAVRAPSVYREERAAEKEAARLLEFVGLKAAANELAKNLPYGDQRKLEIARALATRPRLILLDEPAAGMNPAESAELTKLIEAIRQRGITVLLIEHHMRLVMGISDRITVLDYGKKIAEGTPEEIRTNPDVIKAYLGDEEVG